MNDSDDFGIDPEQLQSVKAELVKAFPILKFFEYEHLPSRLQEISLPFARLAWRMAITLPPNPESSTALRKLLESKDCAVRAALP